MRVNIQSKKHEKTNIETAKEQSEEFVYIWIILIVAISKINSELRGMSNAWKSCLEYWCLYEHY